MIAAAQVPPETQARCSEHPALIAVAPCARCGRFVCEGCQRAGGFCPECLRANFLEAPSSFKRSQSILSLLWLYRALQAGIAIASAWGLFPGGGDSTARYIMGGMCGFFSPVCFMAMGLTYWMWQFSAVRQILALGHELETSPWASVGYWFLPLLNLILPYELIKRMTLALGGPELVRESSLPGWWGLWLASLGLFGVELFMLGLRAPYDVVYLLDIGAAVCALRSAWLCARIIRTLQRRLDALRGGTR